MAKKPKKEEAFHQSKKNHQKILIEVSDCQKISFKKFLRSSQAPTHQIKKNLKKVGE